jgi:pilus assembly protein CpaE
MAMPDSLFDPEPLQCEAAECIAFVGDEQTHGVVSSVLQQFFADAVVRDGDSSAALAYLAEVPAPKVVIVDIGESSQPLNAMLSLTAAFTEDTHLIGIGEINDIALYRELTEAGVTDYLVKPVSEKSLAAALSRSEEAKVEAAPKPQISPDEVHKIIVVGARGGVGASTTAVNLAWIFAEEKGMKTALVDLDLEFGTIALSLDLEPTRGLREALETPARIDNLFISSATAKLSDNLSIMATEENRDTMFDLVTRTAEHCFMPLTIGGGVRTPSDLSPLARCSPHRHRTIKKDSAGAYKRPAALGAAILRVGSVGATHAHASAIMKS